MSRRPTTRCSRRRAGGAVWFHRGHAPAAAQVAALAGQGTYLHGIREASMIIDHPGMAHNHRVNPTVAETAPAD